MDFILVNYNNSDLSIKCVRSIIENSDVGNIIVVDNSSTQIEISKLEQFQQNYDINGLSILFLSENEGYIGAINEGLKLLPNKEYVVVGNNDLEYSTSFTKNVKSLDLNSNIYLISPNIVKSNGVHQNPYRIRKSSRLYYCYLSMLYTNYYVALLFEFLSSLFSVGLSSRDRVGWMESAYIHAAHGACFVLTPFFWRHNESLDNHSFLFGEEFFISEQVRRTGGEIYYLSKAHVLHAEHSTMKIIPSRKMYKYRKEAWDKMKSLI